MAFDLDDEELEATKRLNGVSKKEKIADEMFKKLGYIKTKDGIDCWCVYENKIKIIRFEVGFGQALFIEDKKDDFCCINKEEIQAINQKCKELGWLDEKKGL